MRTVLVEANDDSHALRTATQRGLAERRGTSRTVEPASWHWFYFQTGTQDEPRGPQLFMQGRNVVNAFANLVASGQIGEAENIRSATCGPWHKRPDRTMLAPIGASA